MLWIPCLVAVTYGLIVLWLANFGNEWSVLFPAFTLFPFFPVLESLARHYEPTSGTTTEQLAAFNQLSWAIYFVAGMVYYFLVGLVIRAWFLSFLSFRNGHKR